jgi:hypothetical protein
MADPADGTAGAAILPPGDGTAGAVTARPGYDGAP